MKTNIKLAWRNLWRNKRRTLITVASIFIAVLLSTVMSSVQDGTYGNMIDMSVKLNSGYLQVQNPDFWDDKTINNTLVINDTLIQNLQNTTEIKEFVPRLTSYSLLSYKDKTKGGAVIGIFPDKYNSIVNLTNWLHKGTYLSEEDEGVLLTYNTAEYLNMDVGDTLVMISQGYHGQSAFGIFPIKGIIKFSTPQLNNLGVFMHIHKAQDFFSAYDRATSIVILTDGYTDVPKVKRQLEHKIGNNYSILDWKELNPELVQFIESDKSSGIVMKGILYLVIGFGILATIIMMLAERRKELAVMIALGMQKGKLNAIMFFETLLIGFLGVLSGFIVSIPIIAFLFGHPISLPEDMSEIYLQYGFEPYLFFGIAPSVFYNQVLTVFIITMIIYIVPYYYIRKMKVNKSLRA
ncbi:ABC transporter permease [candidate division KSB1 bacterium]